MKNDKEKLSELMTLNSILKHRIKKLESELLESHTVKIVNGEIIEKSAGIEIEVHNTNKPEHTTLYPKGLLVKAGIKYYSSGKLKTEG